MSLNRLGCSGLIVLMCARLAFPQVPAEKPGGASGLRGFSQEHSRIERDWESKFKAGISRDILRDSMQRLTARPHHVGSAYDKR